MALRRDNCVLSYKLEYVRDNGAGALNRKRSLKEGKNAERRSMPGRINTTSTSLDNILNNLLIGTFLWGVPSKSIHRKFSLVFHFSFIHLLHALVFPRKLCDKIYTLHVANPSYFVQVYVTKFSFLKCFFTQKSTQNTDPRDIIFQPFAII